MGDRTDVVSTPTQSPCQTGFYSQSCRFRNELSNGFVEPDRYEPPRDESTLKHQLGVVHVRIQMCQLSPVQPTVSFGLREVLYICSSTTQQILVSEPLITNVLQVQYSGPALCFEGP